MVEKKEVKVTKEKDEWKVNLVVVDENKPPKKVLIKGDETLDMYAALAKLLNNQELLLEGMLS